MSFLDNLENNLKALEGREQGGLGERSRDAEKSRAKAAAPWAEQLKRSPWTQSMMQKVTRAGHSRRIKVNLMWIGTAFRMEALGHRLELRPEATGIRAVFLKGSAELEDQRVDLEGDPQTLIDRWMPTLEAQKSADEEAARKDAEMLAEEVEEEEAAQG